MLYYMCSIVCVYACILFHSVVEETSLVSCTTAACRVVLCRISTSFILPHSSGGQGWYASLRVPHCFDSVYSNNNEVWNRTSQLIILVAAQLSGWIEANNIAKRRRHLFLEAKDKRRQQHRFVCMVIIMHDEGWPAIRRQAELRARRGTP